MCVANTVSIIYTNDIEAEKPFEVGSYPGKAPPYNEIIMWSNGLKRLSVNLEHTKDKFVDIINSICSIVNTLLFTVLFKIKTLKKNHVLSIESIFSKEICGLKKGRWE
jgi:hypothetical protein